MSKEEIVNILISGGVVVMRTDTVYGILARIDNEMALERIFTIKGRDKSKGMPVLCADMDMVKSIASISDKLELELQEIWPASITVILPAHDFISPLVRGNSPNIAVRIPNDQDLVGVITSVGVPIVATSANRSGHPTTTSMEGLGLSGILDEVDGYIDGGIISSDTKTSTIIDFTVNPHTILRP